MDDVTVIQYRPTATEPITEPMYLRRPDAVATADRT